MLRRLIAAGWVLAALAGQGAYADPAASPATPVPHRPRIGLVLSGGGARGLAHIGVLRVLEELKIPVDMIAGTSVGAIVGGLYAAGMDAKSIDSLMRSVDWQDAFQDRPSRRDLAFRRKQDDRNFLVRLPLGLKHGHLLLPKGLVQGQKLQQTLRSLTLHVEARPDFDSLPTPFRAVATDLETGKAVLLDRGDLALAMRASMSAPGVFAPVEKDGRLLVDGGLAENLPIDVARAMGADVVIVVDVSFQLQTRDQLDSALSISNQMLAILVRRDTDRQKATLSGNDVLIQPDLATASSADFAEATRAIVQGEIAARALAPKLAALSLSDEAYHSYVAQRTRSDASSPSIDFIRVDAASKRYEPTIRAALKPLIGKPLDSKALTTGITELYGLGNFESLDYSLVTQPGPPSSALQPSLEATDDGHFTGASTGLERGTGLEIHARRKSWGPNYVRFGLNLQDDFQGNSSYNAATRFIVTEINTLGAEWLTDAQIGENPRLYSEFYQPFSAERNWFVAPSFLIQARNLPFYQGDTRIAEYRVRQTEGDLDFGRELGNWGEVRVGVHRSNEVSHVTLGASNIPTEQFDSGEYFFRFAYDKLDNLDFPRQGQTFSFQWDAARTDIGADTRADRVQSDFLMARSRGRNTLVWWTTAGTTLDGDFTRVQDYFTLGGFFNLSGRAPLSVSGPHYAITRAIYFRKIGRGGEGLFEFPAYLGMSFELGNAWTKRGDASFSGARKDASAFIGLDTFLGPVYLGAGYDEAGTSAFYLFLGRTF